mgnify:CR=1 FL=1
MKHAIGKILVVMVAAAVVSSLTGCTNWKKKYNTLDVEHQNLQGLYENCMASLDMTAAEKAQMSQELEQLRQQLKEGKTASQATGFEGKDVKVDEAKGTITVTLPNSILFASGEATLKSATNADLDDIYSVLRQRYSGKEIDVVGHTDSDPISRTKDKWQDNWDLSAARALTVLRYLVDRGVNAQNIRGVACGESRPVASNASSAGKAKNRRVEIVVHMR